ncbi:MAG: hypothetical protein LKI80_12005 [Sporolactobacillus sp.]|nr:hypothetical protein [Sporolactobacillus sp.]
MQNGPPSMCFRKRKGRDLAAVLVEIRGAGRLIVDVEASNAIRACFYRSQGFDVIRTFVVDSPVIA